MSSGLSTDQIMPRWLPRWRSSTARTVNCHHKSRLREKLVRRDKRRGSGMVGVRKYLEISRWDLVTLKFVVSSWFRSHACRALRSPEIVEGVKEGVRTNH